jgi:predicted transcriptional regulator
MTERTAISVRLETELVQQLKEEATKDDRTLTSMVKRLLHEALAARKAQA